jgi:prepilin-type N-terminal cleavage/methylation domain-containing protein
MKRSESRNDSAFTLIELLVVVAIIAVLAALLLPALGGARYRAKITSCINQMKQMSYGISAYTGDFSGYYPDGAWGRPDPACIAWSESAGFGTVPPVAAGNYDFRGILRSNYFGTALNKIMKCPLASTRFWYNPSQAEANIDQYNLSIDSLSKSPYSFYFGRACPSPPASYNGDLRWPRSAWMVKAGETFSPATSSSTRFNILVSDFVLGGATSLTTTHRPSRGNGLPAGTYSSGNLGYQYQFGEEANANFGLDDGSVKTYTFRGDGFSTGYFTRFANIGAAYFVPKQCAQ